jgi:hypothetical protein
MKFKTNPATVPLLLLGATAVTVAGVGAVAYSMSQVKPKRVKKKGLPVLIGELTDKGISFRRIDDPDKVQADFLVATNASEEDWADKVVNWMYSNINQETIEIFIWPSSKSESLYAKLKDAWKDRAKTGFDETGKVPFKITFVHDDSAEHFGGLG